MRWSQPELPSRSVRRPLRRASSVPCRARVSIRAGLEQEQVLPRRRPRSRCRRRLLPDPRSRPHLSRSVDAPSPVQSLSICFRPARRGTAAAIAHAGPVAGLRVDARSRRPSHRDLQPPRAREPGAALRQGPRAAGRRRGVVEDDACSCWSHAGASRAHARACRQLQLVQQSRRRELFAASPSRPSSCTPVRDSSTSSRSRASHPLEVSLPRAAHAHRRRRAHRLSGAAQCRGRTAVAGDTDSLSTVTASIVFRGARRCCGRMPAFDRAGAPAGPTALDFHARSHARLLPSIEEDQIESGMTREKSYAGELLLQAVQLTSTGEPRRDRLCHCGSCRRWSAAPSILCTLYQQPDAVQITLSTDDLGRRRQSATAIAGVQACSGSSPRRACGLELVDMSPRTHDFHISPSRRPLPGRRAAHRRLGSRSCRMSRVPRRARS